MPDISDLSPSTPITGEHPSGALIVMLECAHFGCPIHAIIWLPDGVMLEDVPLELPRGTCVKTHPKPADMTHVSLAANLKPILLELGWTFGSKSSETPPV